MKRDYYKDVTTEKPDGKATLENYGRFESNYQQRQVDNVKRGDYVIPAKSMNTMRKYIAIYSIHLFFNSSRLRIHPQTRPFQHNYSWKSCRLTNGQWYNEINLAWTISQYESH